MDLTTALPSDLWPFGLLFVAALTAGIVNTLAGGGSFLTFPALLMTGLDPRAANITSTVFLFPMQVTSGFQGRAMASGTAQLRLRWLIALSLAGGVIGAVLLLLTPSSVFKSMVPWLILFATAVFAYSSFFRKKTQKENLRALGKKGSAAVQFLISIYGGYFGGGIGFLMLAALTLAGMPIRSAGATKNILAAVMNASAVAIFAFSSDIAWPQVAVGVVASIMGGMIGVRLLRHVNEKILRGAVVGIGTMLSIAMFLK